MGTASDHKFVLTRGARIGDHVLVTKGVALEGTAILSQDFSDIARELGLDQQALNEAHSLLGNVSAVPEALILAENGATSMHDVTRGGVLETLLEIALLSKVCIEVDASRLPIPPVVARFSQAFQFDPLRMISSGTLAATMPPERVAGAMSALVKIGVVTADVGRVTDGDGVRLIDEGKTLDYRQVRCEEDELARLWAVYPRSG